MTAEIAVMNKSAIALAADSAVTIHEGKKIYNTVNKLFALSQCHPVGIMIYGNSEFMGVPWETIIKCYRQKLARKKFNNLSEYFFDFIKFIQTDTVVFPPRLINLQFEIKITSFYYNLREEIDKEVEKVIEKNKKVNPDEVKEIVNKAISEHYKSWKEIENLGSIKAGFKEKQIKKRNKIIRQAIKNAFGDLPVDRKNIGKLSEIAALLYIKNRFSNNLSGVVIAGFGEKDVFPLLFAIEVEARLDEHLKYRQKVKSEVGKEVVSSIIPFAQHEMVDLFMEGVDSKYEKTVNKYLSEIFEKYSKVIGPTLSGISDEQKDALEKKLLIVGNQLVEIFKKEMEKYKKNSFISPTTRIVSLLPKEELAVMAETLVNLTSFKRKISLSAETVGGPIDVAVISKGDGFIWIRRKHYFKPELNPQFFERYNSIKEEV